MSCEQKFSDFKVYQHNPFSLTMDNDFRYFAKRGKFQSGSFVADTGEISEGVVSVKNDKTIQDYTKFVKVYAVGLEIIPLLSNPALRFFKHILIQLMHRDSVDFISLPITQTLESCGYKKSSRIVFYEAIKELIKNEVIEKKESYSRDQYWINPNMFFNGNRGEFFRKDLFDCYFKAKGWEYKEYEDTAEE